MKETKVRDLMVPLSGYATVSQEATLKEVILALRKAQQEFDQTRDRHRAILILDNNNKVIGKTSQLDILRALESKYKQMGIGSISRFGINLQLIKTMWEHFDLWNTPLIGLRKLVNQIKAKDFMYTPTEGEYVDADDSISFAIHQIVLGHHQSLLV